MLFVAGTAGTLPGALLDDVKRYRHRVFVERLGWDLPSADGLEADHFDRPDTLYVVARRDDGDVIGTARLLPTDRPYLLQEVFPRLLGGSPLPRSRQIWELSRFAALDLSTAGSSGKGAFVSALAFDLLREVLRVARRHGAVRLISASPVGVERILHRGGFAASRAGPPVTVQGRRLLACWIECRAG